LQYVDSQEEFNKYESYLTKEMKQKWLEYYWSTRKFLYLARISMYYYTFAWHFRFGYEFKFWLPGLEIKYACESAEKVGATIQFIGSELNPVTYDRLYHETRMNVPHYLMKRFQFASSPWTEELLSNR
jgi:hypothetical protein